MRAVRRARGSQLLASTSVMRSTDPPSRRAGALAPCWATPRESQPGGPSRGPAGPANPPGGVSRFPLSLRRSTASEARFVIPLVVPEQTQLSHPYTGGRASLPRGSGTASQSRSLGWAPSAPRAGSSFGPPACGAGAAPCPPRPGQQPSAPAPPSALALQGGRLVLGSGG